MDFKVEPIWNVVGHIPGQSKETVIIGNHRDAWVFGAGDPNSGTAALLEVARGFSELRKRGWVPKKSILLCSWDGEEYGLLGSTAFADANANFLNTSVIAYLNVDVGVSGPDLVIGATHSFDSLIRNVTHLVMDPNTGKPLSHVWTGRVGSLGSGSDYTSFFDRYGVPSLDLGFDSLAYNGVYHSNYDSMYWMLKFGDPEFKYFQTCAQLWGLLALKLADSAVLPFNYTDSALAFYDYLNYSITLAQTYNGTQKIDFSTLTSAVEAFHFASLSIHSEANVSKSNYRLYQTERRFLSSMGLPKRPYYRHVIQAPGLYLGYDFLPFPGVCQAIMEQKWNEAQEQLAILVTRIEEATKYLLAPE
eukprot:TRINITY_DN5550_c0_g2_i4.p1 TRINITY_DN5550_c0_g2~~TRINITY_DN5550_c0_g2_i4.p1  ORF type:complete len:419 (+),score=77.79 TRINITY_DN5550_c0_g2_i4:175-1257(+)